MTDYHYIPPHPWQQGETFNPATNWNLDEFLEDTGIDEWHAVFTIKLGELVQDGVFSWDSEFLNWKSAAYDDAQYERVCSYFIERFRYREISITPFLEWAQMLKRKLVYELMPKYRPLYDELQSDIVPLASENEYYKRRTIDSEYPETLLSDNSDYVSNGVDEEWERVKVGNVADAMESYARFHAVDEALLDELEPMFYSMYTSYVNGL